MDCVSSDECRGRTNLHRAFERLIRDRESELRGEGIPLDEVYEVLIGNDEELQNSDLPVHRAFPVVPNEPVDPVPKVRSWRRRIGDSYVRIYSRDPSDKLISQRRYYHGLILAFIGLLSEGLLETHGYVAGTGEHRNIDRSYWSTRKYSYSVRNNELYARAKNRTSTGFEVLRACLPVPARPADLETATTLSATRGKRGQEKVRRAIDALGQDRIAALRPGERFREIVAYIERQHWGTVSEKTVRRAIKTLGLD